MAMGADRTAMDLLDSWTRTGIAATSAQATLCAPPLYTWQSTRPRSTATRVRPGFRGPVKKGGRKNCFQAAKGIWPVSRHRKGQGPA